MKQLIRQICGQYGQSVTIESGEEDAVSVRAFLQPVTAKEEVFPSSQTEIGWRDARRWLYVGTAVLKPDDRVVWNGMRFAVRSSRAFWLGDTLEYGWAVLECVEEAEA